MIAIITSASSQAGATIKQQLLQHAAWKQQGSFDGAPVYIYQHFALYTITQHHVHAERLDERIPAELFLFATEHASKAGKNALAVHGIGNWGDASFGGKPQQLVTVPATLLKKALGIMEQEVSKQQLPYDVIQEATHHGPLLAKPALFLEIGCDEASFQDAQAAAVIAHTILQLTEATPYPTTLGIGGLHHTPNFKEIQLSGDYAVGHVCPKYALETLTVDVLRQAVEKSMPQVELVLVDWKGLGPHKNKVVALLSELALPWKKTKEVKKTAK